jgi:hypothetical protein
MLLAPLVVSILSTTRGPLVQVARTVSPFEVVAIWARVVPWLTVVANDVAPGPGGPWSPFDPLSAALALALSFASLTAPFRICFVRRCSSAA